MSVSAVKHFEHIKSFISMAFFKIFEIYGKHAEIYSQITAASDWPHLFAPYS